MVALFFDASKVEPERPYYGGREPVPEGDYVGAFTRIELKPTNNGRGKKLELEFQIQHGEQAGKKIFDLLNLENDNAKTVEIAQKRLSAICNATGVIQLQDSSQLLNRPLMCCVSVVPRDDKPEIMRNKVIGFKNADGSDAGFHGLTTNPQAAPQWAGGQQGQPSPTAAPATYAPPQTIQGVQQPPQFQPQQQTYQGNGQGNVTPFQQPQSPQQAPQAAPPQLTVPQGPVPDWARGKQ